MAINTFQRILASGRLAPDDLAAIRIPDISYHATLKRAFRMEEAIQLATFDQVGRGRYGLGDIIALGGIGNPVASRNLNLSAFAPVYRVFLLADDLAAQARFARILQKAARLPYHEAKEFLKQFERELKGGPRGILTSMLLPGLARPIEAAVSAKARRDTARVGVALGMYRARNGRFPEKLDELAPDFIAAVPSDPFDGQPMRLKRTEHGLIVYSIGPDMTDHGGTFDREKNTGDITFTVP